MDLVLKAAERGVAPPPESDSRDVESPFLVPRPGGSRRAVDPAEPAVERGDAHHVVGWPERRCLAEGTRRPGHRLQVPRLSGAPGLAGDGCGPEGTRPTGQRPQGAHHAVPSGNGGDGCGRRGTEEGAAGTDGDKINRPARIRLASTALLYYPHEKVVQPCAALG